MAGIQVTVSADTAAAVRNIEQFAQGMAASLGKLAGFGQLVSGMGPAIAAAFAVDKIAAFAHSIEEATSRAIDHEAATGKLARTTGLTTGTISAMGEAAVETNTPVEVVTNALRMFATRAGDAYTVGGEMRKMFDDNGIALQDVRGAMLPMQDIFNGFLAKWRELPSVGEKAAFATQAFGREGKQLVDVFDKMASSLDELEAKAKAQGTYISPEQAAAAEHFTASVAELREKLEGMWTQFANNILPSLQDFVDSLNRCGLNATNVGLAVAGLTAAFRELATALLIAKTEAEMMGSSLFHLASFEIKEAIDAGVTYITVLRDMVGALVNVAAGIDAASHPLRSGSFQEGIHAIAGVSAAFKDANKAAKGFAKRLGKNLGGGAAKTLEDLKKELADLFKDAGNVWKPPNPEPPKQPNGGGLDMGPENEGAIRESDEADKLIKEIDKKYAESTQGRIALLDLEEKELLRQADKQIHDTTVRETEKNKIIATFAAERRAILEKEAEEAAKSQMEHLKAQDALVKDNPLLSQGQKDTATQAALKAQLEIIDQSIDRQQALLGQANVKEEDRVKANEQIRKLLDEQAAILQQQQALMGRNDIFYQMRTSLQELSNKWGDWAKNAAQDLTGLLNNAVNTLSQNFTKLIMGTENWRQALKQIGATLLSDVLGALMQVIMKLTIAIALQTIFDILSGGGGMTGMSSGIDAAGYSPGMAAGGLVPGAAGGALIDGPGTGTSDSILMRLSKGEFVFSAKAVQEAGAENLSLLHENLVRGISPITSRPDAASQLSGLRGGAGEVHVAGHQMSVALVRNTNEAKEWLTSQEGQQHIVNVIRGRRTQIGVGT